MLSQSGATPQALEVRDFSGGITDNYIGAPSNFYKTADNFYLNKIGSISTLINRPGLSLYNVAYARVPTNLKINKYFDTEEQLFKISNKRIYYVNGLGFNHVTGPSGNDAFDRGSSVSQYSTTKWNDQIFSVNDAYSLPVKVFKDSTWKCHTLGLPAMTGNPTYSTSGSDTHAYAFHYYYQYTNNGVTYEEEGPVYFYGTAHTGAIPNTITFPGSFTLSNASGTNYDLANVKIKVYRTDNGGGTYYLAGEVAHNAATFVDSIADGGSAGQIQTKEPLAYLPDSVQNEAPPRCKYIHQVNGNLIAANLEIDGVVYPGRFRMNAKPFIWSMPGEFEEDLGETIKGVSSFNSQPIIFCDKKVYRIEGEYFIDGSGSINKRVIHPTAGCINNNSIVQTDVGLFWCGNDGWYWTNGYDVLMVSKHLNTTYRDMTDATSQKTFIQGTYETRRRQVTWLMLRESTNLDSDCVFVLDLNHGIKDDMPFTTYSGGSNFRATSIHYFQNKLIQSHYEGYTLFYDDTAFDDVKIDVALAVALWTTITIIYLHDTSALDFGTGSERKWVPSISVRAENASSVSLLISANNDNSLEYKDLKEVIFKGKQAWGDSIAEWGDADIRWNYFPILAFERRMPAGGLRCTYKQLRFTNSYSLIDESASAGTAVFNGLSNTAVLGSNWASSISEYFIYTSYDNYENSYRIISQSTNTITVEDLAATFPTGTFDWKIYGYRKGEILKIISYTLNFALIGPSFEPYKAV